MRKDDEFKELENQENNCVWGYKFIKIGLLHFVVVGVITILFVLSHVMEIQPVISIIMSYADAEFTPGMWFTFGYQNYVVGSIGVLIFGFLYHHIENIHNNPSKKIVNYLSGIHLIAMNIGLVFSTFTFMITGWISGIAMVSKDYGGQGIDTMTVHNDLFMKIVPFGTPNWIGFWILVMSVGIIVGSIGLMYRWRK